LATKFGQLDEILIGGMAIGFSPTRISEAFRLPVVGLKLTDLQPLTIQEKRLVFGDRGEEACTFASWNMALAEDEDLAIWIVYLNQIMFLAATPEMACDEAIQLGILSWQGVQVNWSQHLYDRIKLEICTKKTQNPLYLVSGILIGAICHQLWANLSVLPIATNVPEEAVPLSTMKVSASPQKSAEEGLSTKFPIVLKTVTGNQTKEEPAANKYRQLFIQYK